MARLATGRIQHVPAEPNRVLPGKSDGIMSATPEKRVKRPVTSWHRGWWRPISHPIYPGIPAISALFCRSAKKVKTGR